MITFHGLPFSNFLALYGPYWLHLKEAWEQRDNPNLHFMFYEDFKQNNAEELKRLDKFLGTKLTQEQLEKVRGCDNQALTLYILENAMMGINTCMIFFNQTGKTVSIMYTFTVY